MRLPIPVERIQLQPVRAFPPGSLIIVEGTTRGLGLRCTWNVGHDDPPEPMVLMLQGLNENVRVGSMLEVRSFRDDVLGVAGPIAAEADLLGGIDGGPQAWRGVTYGRLGVGPGGAFISGLYHPDPSRMGMLWVSTTSWEASMLNHGDKPQAVFSSWRLRLPFGTDREPLVIDMPLEPGFAFA